MNLRKTDLFKTFPSVSALGRWIEATPRANGAMEASRTNSPSTRWDFNLGLTGALDMAKAGGRWADGVRKLAQARIAVDAITGKASRSEQIRSTVGHTVDVPAFLAGQPCSMITEDPDEEGKRTVKCVRIGVCALVSASVTGEQLFNRGAALLSAIDTLEDQGIRVELVSVIPHVAGGVWRRSEVTLKAPEDAWTPAAVAFGLCHPAFSRRVGFAVVERDPVGGATVTNNGYGSGSEIPQMDGGCDVWFPYLHTYTQDQCSTPEGALAYVEDVVGQGLARLIQRVTQEAA